MLTTSLGSLVCFSENLFTEASSVAKFPKYDVISCSKISHSLVIAAYMKVIEIKLCLESFFFFFFFYYSYTYFFFLFFFYLTTYYHVYYIFYFFSSSIAHMFI